MREVKARTFDSRTTFSRPGISRSSLICRILQKKEPKDSAHALNIKHIFILFCFSNRVQKIRFHLKRSYDVLKDKSYFEIIKQSIAPILIFLIKDGEIDEAVNLVTSNYDFVKEKAYDILECIKKNGNKINVSNYDAFLTKFKELKFIS